ncbi:MAG: cytidine deaminase [Balneolaceae bacterium]|nr:cytidine deaminase [Balneolaceae bacterium]
MTLKDLQTYSYVPYSETPGISVVRSQGDGFFPGVRIENASFPLTINSLQSALFNCISEGEKPKAAYINPEQSCNIEFWKSEYGLWIYDLEELDESKFTPILMQIKSDQTPKKLHELLGQAQPIYSDFPVSALLETEQGFISGVNIECSEWSYGLCAERVALSKALAYGIETFKAIHIHTRDGEFSSPCGACRQVLVEHMKDQQVHLYHADGTNSQHFTSDLLPYSFHSSKLKKK